MKKITLLLWVAFLSPFYSLYAQDQPLWLRYPAISPDGTTVVFSYKGDLFSIPSAGGTAIALTTNEGYEFMPVWSPDGKTLAFASDRFGNFDVFTMPAIGGQATRLTSFSRSEYPYCFTPDGKSVVYSSLIQDVAGNMMFPSARLPELYKVAVQGGRPQQILSTPAIDAFYDQSGTKLYYHDQKGYENDWRKHHTSSIARDVWVYDQTAGTHTKLTDFAGEDRNPVLSADEQTVYYLSEQSGSFNVWKFSANNPAQTTQVTFHENHPVRFLTISSGNVLCYSYNGELYTVSDGAQPQKIAVQVNIDGLDNEVEYYTSSSSATEMAVSPNGKEIVFVVRGEVFVTSVDYGTTRRITNTPEQERSVSFSPDGRAVLYASERNGSWNIYQTKLVRIDEKSFATATLLKEEVVIETIAETFQPAYSPDGKEVAFLEERVTLKVINLASKQVRTILQTPNTYSYSDGDQWYQWSPDGKWFIVQFSDVHLFLDDIALVDAQGNQKMTNLTPSGYNDSYARWMMKGNAMIWFTDRQGLRSHGSWGAQRDVYGMFFTQEALDKFNLTKEERELLKDNTDTTAKKDDKDKDKIEPLKIEFAGLEDRIQRLTIHSSSLADAILSDDGTKLFYLCMFDKGYDLWVHDFAEEETKKLVDLKASGGSLEMSKDGKTLFVFASGKMWKIGVSDSKKTAISYKAEMYLDAAAERAYMFDHAWRQVKKKFYVENLHNVDWDFYKTEYARTLPYINNNYDFAEMMSEMLGELNASHTGSGYRSSSSDGDETASLGAFYDSKYTGDGLKIVEIIENGPLQQAGTKIAAGTVIEKIDGVAITAGMDYFPLLNHKEGQRTLLSCYNPDTKQRWDEIVKPASLGAEYELLYQRWIKKERAEIEKLSNGRLGYVHVRGMNGPSFRQVYSDLLGRNAHKEAIIVDTRFNGGGWLHDDLAVLLSGKKYVDYVPKGNRQGWDPMSRWTKPSIVIMSESNYSDAHAFPYVYKTLEIGELVGMPVPGTMTAVWWETLQDNTLYFGIPQVGSVDGNGNYLENQQLEPDYKILLDYDTVIKGRDQQLEKAVEVMLKQLDEK